MVLCVPLRRRVTNWNSANKRSPSAGDFSALHIMAHLHLEDLLPLFLAAVTPVLQFLGPAIIKTHFWAFVVDICTPADDNHKKTPRGFIGSIKLLLIFMFPLILKVFYYDYWGLGLRNPAHLLQAQKSIMAVVMSYGFALGIRFLLTSTIYGIRFILDGMISFLYSIIYKNIVPKPIRKWVRSQKRAFVPSVDTFIVICSISLCVLLVILTHDKREEIKVMHIGHYIISISTLGTVAANAVFIFKALFFRPSAPSNYEHYQLSVALLYLPIVILSVPSAYYSYALLFEHQDMYAFAYPSFSIFATERMNFLMASLGIFCHWIVLTQWKDNYAHTGSILGFQFYIKSVGRADVSFTTSSNVRSLKWMESVGSADCCHEDGGRNATFEEVLAVQSSLLKAVDVKGISSNKQGIDASDENDVTATTGTVEMSGEASPHKTVSEGVDMGCTFRVIHCECHKDRKLKDVSQWC